MSNRKTKITFSFPDEVLKESRALAAEHGVTLPALIRSYLRHVVESGRTHGHSFDVLVASAKAE